MTPTQNAVRARIEYYCDRVEATLAAHSTPVRIHGGTIGPRVLRLFVDPAPHVRFANIRRLEDEIALALRTDKITLSRTREGILLEMARSDPQPVTLDAIMKALKPLPVATVALGLTSAGAPLAARLSSPDVAHILVAGTTGSGKSILLRSAAMSLILGNRSDVTRIAIIDPKGRTFPRNFSAPHLIQPVQTDQEEAADLLKKFVGEMERRDLENTHMPRIVIFIDELVDLLMVGNGIEEDLERLMQRGRESGIHIFAATQRPQASVLSGLIRANFPLRLVGRVVSPADARVASGRGGTKAHTLNGKGDFLAVGSGESTRFQAAIISDSEIENAKGHMIRNFPFPTDAIEGAMHTKEVSKEKNLSQLRSFLTENPNATRSAITDFMWPGKRYAGSHYHKLNALLEEVNAPPTV